MTEQSEGFPPDAVTCREDFQAAEWIPIPGQHPHLAIDVVLLQVVVVGAHCEAEVPETAIALV